MKHKRIQKLVAAAVFSIVLFTGTTAKVFAGEDLSMPLINSLPGQSDIITSLSVNADSNVIASAGKDGNIKFYYITDNKINKTITVSAHDKSINKVVFSPQNNLLASCSDDGKIKLWNADTGELMKTLNDGNEVVSSVGFNADGSILYSGNSDGSLKFWKTDIGQVVYSSTFDSGVLSITYNNIDNILAVLLKDNSIVLIDVGKQSVIGRIQNVVNTGSDISKIVYSHNGKYLVCLGESFRQPIILSSEENYKKLDLGYDKFRYDLFTIWNDCSFSSDDHYIIGCDMNSDHIGIFNFYSGELIKKVDVHPTSIALLKDDSELLVGNLLDNINVYDTSKLPVDSLESIKIDVSGNSFSVGKSIELKLIGHYKDGTDRVIDNKYIKWQVADKDGEINGNIFTSKHSGNINVTATYGGINSTRVFNIVEEKSLGYIDFR